MIIAVITDFSLRLHYRDVNKSLKGRHVSCSFSMGSIRHVSAERVWHGNFAVSVSDSTVAAIAAAGLAETTAAAESVGVALSASHCDRPLLPV